MVPISPVAGRVAMRAAATLRDRASSSPRLYPCVVASSLCVAAERMKSGAAPASKASVMPPARLSILNTLSGTPASRAIARQSRRNSNARYGSPVVSLTITGPERRWTRPNLPRFETTPRRLRSAITIGASFRSTTTGLFVFDVWCRRISSSSISDQSSPLTHLSSPTSRPGPPSASLRGKYSPIVSFCRSMTSNWKACASATEPRPMRQATERIEAACSAVTRCLRLDAPGKRIADITCRMRLHSSSSRIVRPKPNSTRIFLMKARAAEYLVPSSHCACHFSSVRPLILLSLTRP